MKKHKYGFTLGEILVCILIIGIIMALSVQTLGMVRSSYTALTYFSFKNIQIAARELIAGQTAKTTESSSSVMLCKKDDNKLVYILKPDEIPEENSETIPKCSSLPYDVEEGTNTVCNNLTKILNTSGSSNCDNLYAVKVEGNEPKIKNLNPLNPNFVTTNGQRYFMSKRTFDPTISEDYGFRLLAVDLNGKTKPNISETNARRSAPDIVTFMIMDEGTVYPLGVAADNFAVNGNKKLQYINAKAKGYYYSDKKGSSSGNIPADCYVKKKSGQEQTCNFRVVSLKNSTDAALYGYREAYCMTMKYDKDPIYEDYCKNITKHSLCPPSSSSQRFDECSVERIKPMFRFNF